MADDAIYARDLKKSYRIREGGVFKGRTRLVEAIRGVSFRSKWGEIYGLLGPNGAGKTTTVKILATLLIPDSGDAYVAGYHVVREPIEVRKRIGVMLSVERGFFWKLTGRENLLYFGMLYGLSGERLRERVEWALDIVGLKNLGGDVKRFEDMSLGMKARLGLARALLKDPKVLILDEPTLGLDPPSARLIRELLRDMASKGKGVLITTHNMYEAEILCDRVGIITNGMIRVEGSPRELKRRVMGRLSILLRVSGDNDSIRLIVDDVSREMGLPAGIVGSDGSSYRVRILADPGDEDRVIARVISEAVSRGLRVLESRVEEPSLEDVFIEVAGDGTA